MGKISFSADLCEQGFGAKAMIAAIHIKSGS